MKFKLVFLSLFWLAFHFADAAVYYVATDGSDSNPGTLAAPFATVQRGQQSALAGDTVYIRGGNYRMKTEQIARYYSIWAYVTELNKSGSAGKRICYWAYPGETPVFDLTDIKPADCRIMAFMVTGSYLHIKGLEVTGTQVTILTHTQSECFHNEGSNNLYEQLKMHDNQAIGFYLTKGSNNLILNCDAWNNADTTSENKKGGNADGFGGHPNKGSTGNVFRGCRAWFNSDDGYDCISASESIVFDNCWAFYNGYKPGFTSMGDGNGFKVGGHGAAPTSINNLPSPVPSHTTKFCLAYRNKANGFYANHHVLTGNYWYNNTAYRNSTNFNMLSQRIVKDTAGNNITQDVPGINHVLRNNLSFRYGTQRDTLNIGSSNNTFNSFTPGIGVTVASDDFYSLLESLLTAERQPDSSLPENGFLRPVAGSDLLDKGTPLGFDFKGMAPDLGAFEFDPGNGLNRTEADDVQVYPVPAGNEVVVHFQGQAHIRLFSLEGKAVAPGMWAENTASVSLSGCRPGIYLLRIEQDGRSCIKKLIRN